MNKFLEWYRQLYQPVENKDYQKVIDKYLKEQNNYINLLMRWIYSFCLNYINNNTEIHILQGPSQHHNSCGHLLHSTATDPSKEDPTNADCLQWTYPWGFPPVVVHNPLHRPLLQHFKCSSVHNGCGLFLCHLCDYSGEQAQDNWGPLEAAELCRREEPKEGPGVD